MSGGAAKAAVPAASSQPGAPRIWAASDLLPRRPYPGLRPFEKMEWPIFRGRDRLIQDVLAVLAGNHFASIIGPSGSGKSSLVRAGVLATLERRHSRMGMQWRYGTMRPLASPLWSMADGILRALRPDMIDEDNELPNREVARLYVLIGTSGNGPAVVMQEFGLPENENFILLIDQLEEIFRNKPNMEDDECERFIELLLAVAKGKPPGFYIIATMRSEYLGCCARFSGLAEMLNETHYLLPRMTEEELRQAIVEPAELKNGRIQDALIDRLIHDVRAREDQLPILQHALSCMWIREEAKTRQAGSNGESAIEIGLAEYKQLGGERNGRKAERVNNALSRHGDRILERLSPEGQKVAEVMFRRMVEVEEHSNRLRRPTRCGTVAHLAHASLDVVQRVVDAFRDDDASFIYASRQRVTDDTSIDIMHESLIRQWDTLDRWVRQEKASYEVYNDLCRAAQRMQEGRGALLAGLALSRARHWLCEEQPTHLWAQRYGGDFDAAITFLTESEKAGEAARRERDAERDRQHEQELEALRERIVQAEAQRDIAEAARAEAAEALGLAQRGKFKMVAMSVAVVGLVSAILAVAITLYLGR